MASGCLTPDSKFQVPSSTFESSQVPEKIQSHLSALFSQALERVAPGTTVVPEFERPKAAAHGDLATSVALRLAGPLKRSPREIAQAIVAALPASEWVAATQIAGPDFINVHLAPAAHQAVLARVFAAGEGYGRSVRPDARRVIVEFVSANPTGPLHVGHGRQGILGDALCALLEATGHEVVREFYYNDAGVQIRNLAVSVQVRVRELLGLPAQMPEDGYRGDYVRDIAADYLARKTVAARDVHPVTASGDPDDLEAIRRFAVSYLRHEQDMDLQAFGVRFDNYYLESSLYEDGRVEAAVQALISAGKTYEAEGALWLRTTDYGDDKDRVMRTRDGRYTYFVPDVAYHVTKWERGFARAINIQGSDHHGTVARVRAGLQALGAGIPPGFPDYVLHKMVTVMRGGEEVKISKRAGSYVTLRDLIDEVGRDAVRFFLASRRADTEFVFDVDLAKSQSEENPVYYVQYAHARICSVLGQWGEDPAVLAGVDWAVLTGEREIGLMRKLDDFPGVVEAAAAEFAPHQIAFYLRELAAAFHGYYNAERFLVDDAAVRLARLSLATAVREVLRNGLALIGVSAPQAM